MDKQKLLNLVKNPENVREVDAYDLEEVIQEYPYFQAARLLMAKAKRSSNEIKTAAAYTSHRLVLKKVINSEFDVDVNLPNLDELEIEADDINAFETLANDEPTSSVLEEVSEEKDALLFDDKTEDNDEENTFPFIGLDESENESNFKIETEEAEQKEETSETTFYSSDFFEEKTESENLISKEEEVEESVQEPEQSITESLFGDHDLDALSTTNLSDLPYQNEQDELLNKEDEIQEASATMAYFASLEKEETKLEEKSIQEENLIEEEEKIEAKQVEEPIINTEEKEEVISNAFDPPEYEFPNYDNSYQKEQTTETTNADDINLDDLQAIADPESSPTHEDLMSSLAELRRIKNQESQPEEVQKAISTKEGILDTTKETPVEELQEEAQQEFESAPSTEEAIIPNADQLVSNQEEIKVEKKPIYIDPNAFAMNNLIDTGSFGTIDDNTPFHISSDYFALDDFLSLQTTDNTDKGKGQYEIINQFIANNPQINARHDNAKLIEQKDLAKKSVKQNKTAISENLAIILKGQGKFDKAKEIYKALMLKYPEKKAYFAHQIEKMKD